MTIYRDNRESLEAQLRRSEEELRLTKSDLELVKKVRERHVYIHGGSDLCEYVPFVVSSVATSWLFLLGHWKAFLAGFAISLLLYLVMIVRGEFSRKP